MTFPEPVTSVKERRAPARRRWKRVWLSISTRVAQGLAGPAEQGAGADEARPLLRRRHVSIHNLAENLNLALAGFTAHPQARSADLGFPDSARAERVEECGS